MGDKGVHVIVIERGPDWPHKRCVRIEPDPADGTWCEGSFLDPEKARQFAHQLRRARGWPIIDRTVGAHG